MPERVINLICEYRNSLCEPTAFWPRERFETRVYQLWALDELEWECRYSDKPPKAVILSFLRRMQEHAQRREHTRILFLTAADAAEALLDALNAMKE